MNHEITPPEKTPYVAGRIGRSFTLQSVYGLSLSSRDAHLSYIIHVPSKRKDTTLETLLSISAALGKNNVSDTQQFAECLRQIADRHALLIMRELVMNVRRFQDIQAQTKICSHVLSSRLKRLENDGIVEKRQYCIRPPRFEYFATAKGKALDEVLFAAANWNILWGPPGPTDEPSIIAYDKATGIRLGALPPHRSRSSKKVDSR